MAAGGHIGWTKKEGLCFCYSNSSMSTLKQYLMTILSFLNIKETITCKKKVLSKSKMAAGGHIGKTSIMG